MIDKDKVIARVRELYEEARGYKWDGFKAPEQRPQISRQIVAVATALVEALNEREQSRLDAEWEERINAQ